MSASNTPAMTTRRCISVRMNAISCALLRVKTGIDTAPGRRERAERAVPGAVPVTALAVSISVGRDGGTTAGAARLEGRAGPRCLRLGLVPSDGAFRLESLKNGPPLRPREPTT